MKPIACILSAGLSLRMGRHKALLPIDKGETFLSHIVKTLKRAGITDISVVISMEEITRKSKNLEVRWIINRRPEKGQLFSFQLCVHEVLDKARPEEISGIFLVPVDHPFVKRETYERLLSETRRGKILVPTYMGRRGHPTFFPFHCLVDILEAPLEVGARAVLKMRKEEVLEIEVDDPGVLLDIDTPKDLKRIIDLKKPKKMN